MSQFIQHSAANFLDCTANSLGHITHALVHVFLFFTQGTIELVI